MRIGKEGLVMVFFFETVLVMVFWIVLIMYDNNYQFNFFTNEFDSLYVSRENNKEFVT